VSSWETCQFVGLYYENPTKRVQVRYMILPWHSWNMAHLHSIWVHLRLLWGSCLTIFNLLCSVLYITTCSFIHFILAIVLWKECLKQWWSSILPISTKRTTTSHLLIAPLRSATPWNLQTLLSAYQNPLAHDN
jgi:hypothetical protein